MPLQTPTVLSEKFDSGFEKNLLHLLYRDFVFAAKYASVLKPNYFGSVQHRALFIAFYDYFLSFKRLPNAVEANLQIVKEHGADSDIVEMLKENIKYFYDNLTPNADFVEKLIIEFIKKAELSKTIWEAVNGFENLDIEILREKINDIANIKNKTTNLGISSDDFMQRLLLKEDDFGNGLSCSYRNFNTVVRGGLRAGELVVLMAPTNRGKTAALVNFGRSYMSMGASVLHYSLEMPEDDIMDRYIASMTQTRINDLSNPTLFKGVVSILQNYNIFTNKKLYIKYFPAKTASVLDIEAHYNILKETGLKPDLILLDYADLLKPPRDRKDKRFELGELYEHIRSFASIAGIPIITASQTNRAGESNDFNFRTKKIVEKPNALNITHIAEDWSKAATADYIFGIRRPFKMNSVCSTQEELLMIFDILKSRHSARGGMLGFKMEFSKCYMDEVSLNGINLTNEEEEEE